MVRKCQERGVVFEHALDHPRRFLIDSGSRPNASPLPHDWCSSSNLRCRHCELTVHGLVLMDPALVPRATVAMGLGGARRERPHTTSRKLY